jgi:ABC-type branched-subunit amino acid transport system substrate-binding protein
MCAHVVGVTNSLPIRIGLLLPPEETEAASLRQGAAIAVAWANQSTTQVELVIRGRPGQWGDDGVEAGRMVLDDGVSGMIAPSGGVPTHLALQVAGRTATPVVSLCGDSSITGAGVPWSIRIVPSTAAEARAVMAGFTNTHARWAALVPTERTGREITRDLSNAAATVGCKLDPVIVIERHLTDFSTLASRLPQPWPDGVLIWLDTQPAAFASRYLRAAGFTGTLAGPGRLLSEQFRQSAGSALEGFAIARPVVDPAAAGFAQFETDYARAFGGLPDPTAAMACDAASLLINLARQAGPADIYRQFPISCKSRGVTGIIEFDQQGNRLLSLELRQFRAGSWRVLGTAP